MNVYEITIRHTSKFKGLAENDEALKEVLAQLQENFEDSEILNIENVGDFATLYPDLAERMEDADDEAQSESVPRTVH